MKVPVSWLHELVKVDTDLAGLSDRLTFAGLEVEAIETVGSDFAGVVAGRVVAVEPHPNADTLQLCMVEYGTGEPMRVVCGAPNVAVGGGALRRRYDIAGWIYVKEGKDSGRSFTGHAMCKG